MYVLDDCKMAGSSGCVYQHVAHSSKVCCGDRLLTGWSYRRIISNAEVSLTAKRLDANVNVELAWPGHGPLRHVR